MRKRERGISRAEGSAVSGSWATHGTEEKARCGEEEEEEEERRAKGDEQEKMQGKGWSLSRARPRKTQGEKGSWGRRHLGRETASFAIVPKGKRKNAVRGRGERNDEKKKERKKARNGRARAPEAALGWKGIGGERLRRERVEEGRNNSETWLPRQREETEKWDGIGS